MYSTESLHSAVVEVVAKRGARVPLHDDPELGQQHLQPGDQAGGGLRRLAGGMGRRQPGQPPDDEVPGGLHDGAGRPRRDPLGRLRLGRPAPGRRRQGGPLRPAHLRAASSPSRSPRTAAGQLPRPGQGRARGEEVEVERRLRRPDPRPQEPQRHLSLHRDRRAGRDRSATRPASRGSARSSCST